MRARDCRSFLTLTRCADIDKWNLLPPLLVIQTLAHNSTATLGVVKDYITRRLQQERSAIDDDERLVRQYRDETDRMRAEIEQLKNRYLF